MIRVTMLRAISLGRDAEKLRCLSRLAHRGVSRTCLGGLETWAHTFVIRPVVSPPRLPVAMATASKPPKVVPS